MDMVARPVTAESGSLFPMEPIRALTRTAGDRAALIDRGDTVTYAALADRVGGLARRLRAAGAGPERPVAVLLDRSAETVVAMLAVLAVGGAYCPLDASAPAARTAGIVARAGCRIAITDEAGASRLPAGIVVVEPAGPGGPFELVAVPPDTLAYVMHTSGSTGVPKAVAMTRRGLARLISWQLDSGETGLRTLQFTATSFDVTFQEVLSTLAGGGCLVVAPESARRDPEALLETIVRQRVQRIFLPYVGLQLLAVASARTGTVPDALRHVVTAGERLIVTPAIRAFFAALPRCRLDNHYGPTEAHLVTSATLGADRAAWPEVPGIGPAVGGVRCHVLDEKLSPVPDGASGELYVGGTGVARGYLGDPARTAERFVADPFRPGRRLYRTGDVVTATADGYDFAGRADEQLKVRGFRVEPAEVEHALSSHPRVDAAAVGLRAVGDGVPVLVGYLQTDGPLPHRELTEYLRELLPAYMIPTRYVSVATLPRTSTGKLDRRALAGSALPEVSGPAAPGSAGRVVSGEPAAPVVADPPVAADLLGAPAVSATPQQPASLTEIVTAVWTRVLGHGEFDGDEDFFDVGGDSLLATWVVAELAQALRRPVELSLLLEYGTVDELAAALGSGGATAVVPQRSSQIVTLRRGPSARSVYFVHPLGGELPAYRELAHASTAPVRLLGIGWTGDPPPFGRTLPELARGHVAQLRTIEPDGPYRLAGWSFGGVLAYEMAQQLRAAGAVVEFLGLFDANPIIDPITGLPMADTPFLDLLDTVVARLDDPATTDAELRALTSGPTWLQLMGAPVAAGASTGYLRKVLETARTCMNAAMRYRPDPYSGPVHFFRPTGADPDIGAAVLAATRRLCAGPLRIVPLPGEHRTFIRGQHVTTAAAQWDAVLAQVGAEGSTNRGTRD
ncbi:amino acid adenylation domain-containing protein [Nocardia sp. alder85J]|uniref:amino acid adenylation domain-containing protein n=1 Tax=Nocardia sp. alder85J TaxID=2862949 RepID=UPI001CD2D0AD|nr:amino acid adenylation domain-containing protein [Nocardia sp. alder85J]MCX4091614.1 amino acid adenylation domain-containing protein [Nocardia sp. alder85J]